MAVKKLGDVVINIGTTPTTTDAPDADPMSAAARGAGRMDPARQPPTIPAPSVQTAADPVQGSERHYGNARKL
jgi:hypothetical protein